MANEILCVRLKFAIS